MNSSILTAIILSIFFAACGSDDYQPESSNEPTAPEATILVDETTGGHIEPQDASFELYIDGKLIDVFEGQKITPNKFKDCFYRTAYCSGACSVVSNPMGGYRVIVARDLGDGLESSAVIAPNQCEIPAFSYRGKYEQR